MKLTKGATGQAVSKLQEALSSKGFVVKADGSFGAKTEAALKNYQRRNGLVPDGIAGPKTLASLAAAPASASASFGSFLADLSSRLGGFLNASAVSAHVTPEIDKPKAGASASTLDVSPAGLGFIFRHEAWAGVSNKLHWPKGASGVTLGPGYDMKERTADAIRSDMLAIGLSAAHAQLVSGAAGLKDDAAETFAKTHKKAFALTDEQETQLLKHIVPAYVRIVRNRIKVELQQHEFDALVSFAYNPGGRMGTVATHINAGEVAKAMQEIQRANTSKGVVMKGLTNRREHEVALYLHGRYQH